MHQQQTQTKEKKELTSKSFDSSLNNQNCRSKWCEYDKQTWNEEK